MGCISWHERRKKGDRLIKLGSTRQLRQWCSPNLLLEQWGTST